MKVLYFDCGMGAAGDMLTAALLELFDNQEEILEELNRLGIPGVRFHMEKVTKCGIVGTHMRVAVGDTEEHEHMHDHHHSHGHEYHHEHHHSGMEKIRHIVSHMNVSEKVRLKILLVYTYISLAESDAHGVPVEEIHFHEVGTMDAVADITAVCYLMDKLNPDKVCASPIHVGSGQVRCAHGVLPVPAPATAHILKGVPIYGGEIRGELCTPTGAALLKTFVKEFGAMPIMAVDRIGYGMGKKDFSAANCVRTMLGESQGMTDSIVELSCNLDDMTGEEIGFAQERISAAGALDVFTTAVSMKKNRPGILLTVLCRPEDKENLVREIFRHTTTLGIRESVLHRYTLERTQECVPTPHGFVRRKLSAGYGVQRRKAEFEDLAEIAREKDITLISLRDI